MTPTLEANAPHVYRAIAAITADLAVEGISKDRKNQQQGFQFRGIDDVYNALSPLLGKHKLCLIPRVTSRTCEERASKSGGALFYVVVDVTYVLASGVDGSTVEARVMAEAMDSADKATNKAMSAAYKYLAFMLFAIPTEGQSPDADEGTPEPAAKHQPASKPEPVPDVVPYGHHPSYTDKEGKAFAIALGKLTPVVHYDALAKWLEGDSESAVKMQDALGVLPSRPSQWATHLREKLFRIVSKDPAKFVLAFEGGTREPGSEG